jgi:catechol 2,3-dioxygenase-like lactoylglutathione lyase family enzyme
VNPRVRLITLGVPDLARSRAFYAGGLGWSVAAPSNDQIAFLQLDGRVLALGASRSWLTRRA